LPSVLQSWRSMTHWTISQSEIDSMVDECMSAECSSSVNKEGRSASFFVSHYLFMQCISIPSLVGNLTIIVVFLVLSGKQNVITNSLNRSNIVRIKIVSWYIRLGEILTQIFAMVFIHAMRQVMKYRSGTKLEVIREFVAVWSMLK
jgi:hypothetical protein